ncbi:MAG: DNA repair protein RecO [Candidatus Sungbacteria bacterium]|nr:DNA repair protein RecO [Candidatus Sungbacteria bacterium]
MYVTDAIILKKSDYGETGALFTLYTKEYGKIRALAQGVKKEDAKLKGHLEPLSLSSVSFVLGKNGERLTHASLINYWPALRSDWRKLKLTLEVAGAVDQNCFPGQKDETLWNVVLDSFHSLEDSDNDFDAGNFLRSFQKRFSTSLGYEEEWGIIRPWAS